jgi:hypothetical protein
METQQFSRQRLREQDLPRAVLAKWNAATLDEGFVPLPKRLLRCLPQVFQGGDAIERLTLVMAIADYRRPNLTRGPSSAFLAFLSGLLPERVMELLEALKGDGLISYTLKGADELEIDIGGLLRRVVSLTAENLNDVPY